MQRATHNLQQGSVDWQAHRAAHYNASDAPAMMGASKYRSRSALLREKATGIGEEIDAGKQRLFDAGHAAEAAIRQMIEAVISDDLYPVTMSVNVNGMALSASLDGLNLDGNTAFEAKLWNDELAASVRSGDLAPHYYWQLEQQLLVSGAERVIFATGDGVDRLEWMEYRAIPGRADALIAGWSQFERDLADYKPEDVTTKPAGRSPETLPALRIEAKGMVTASNMAEFREHAMAVLGQINRDLQTDEDFSNAESTVKWCSGVEDRLAAAKANVLAQMADVDAVCRTIDDVSAETRRIRLELDKLVKAEKENRKAQIVQAGVESIRAHYDTINATLGQHAIIMPALHTDIGAATKGLKTLTSIREKVDAAVANAKISASQHADKVRANIAVVESFAEHAHLIPDRVALCASKSPEDLRNLVAARIAEHKAREEARLEAERERIRREESARIERERAAAELAAAKQSKEGAELSPEAQAINHQEGAQRFADHHRVPSIAPTKAIKLGDINAAIAPLSITADGLASIGFASCGQDRAAKLYNAADLPLILRKLSVMLAATANRADAA